jgi:hypothetical protein
MKEGSGDPAGPGIHITAPDQGIIGRLSPVTWASAADPKVIELLTRWRRKYMGFFMSQFEAVEAQTRRWIENATLVDDARILFLVCEKEKPIGNFGVACLTEDSGKLDNLIRGEHVTTPRLMFYSEIAMVNWLYTDLGLTNVYLYVFTHNDRTIRLHESVGFSVEKVFGLTRVSTPDLVRYECNFETLWDGKEFGLAKMTIDKKAFYERHGRVVIPSAEGA